MYLKGLDQQAGPELTWFLVLIVVVEWIETLDSRCGVSDQQSVGSSPGRNTFVLKQDTFGICQRPVFSLSVSQHMNKENNEENHERKNIT